MPSTTPEFSHRLAQTVGITLATAWAGAQFSFSYFLVPRLLDAPVPVMLKQWSTFYHSGKKVAVPVSILAASTFFYLAYKTPSSVPQSSDISRRENADFWKYVAAGVLSLSLAPFTALVMGGTNGELLSRAKETGALAGEVALGGKTTAQLVAKWGVLNYMRASLIFSSGVIGLWTSLA